MKINRKGGAVVVAFGVSLFSSLMSKESSSHKYSLENAWNYYGFFEPTQKNALRNIFERAAIIPKGKSWDQAFPPKASDELLVKDIVTAVQASQERLTVRSGVQERWEVSAADWMTKNGKEMRVDLRDLGFVDALMPSVLEVDAICVLGAAKIRMETRVAMLDSLISHGLKTKKVILLAGERYVTEGVDGSQEDLSRLSAKLEKDTWKKLTETDLIKDLYNNTSLARSISPEVIDTPSGALPRPTTQTTMMALVDWLKEHPEVKRIVFVSNQPYVKYQRAIIDTVLEEQGLAIQYEVVGPAVLPSSPVSELLEGLGTYLWAATPRVLSGMEVRIDDPQLIASIVALYVKNPLIFSAVPIGSIHASGMKK